jgi:hypothetical protein
MKFHIEDIVANAKVGWANLHIASSYLKWTSPVIDYPDEWFNQIRGSSPCLGKQYGHTHLSRAGFEAFASDLKAAFQQSNNPQCATWDEYVDQCRKHFVNTEKARQKLIKKHQKILNELQSFNV